LHLFWHLIYYLTFHPIICSSLIFIHHIALNSDARLTAAYKNVP
jgi:hypothetical protein